MRAERSANADSVYPRLKSGQGTERAGARALGLELPGAAIHGSTKIALPVANCARLPFRPASLLKVGSSTIKSECRRGSLGEIA